MRKLALFLFVLGTFQAGIAQSSKKNLETDIVSHQVQLGETIRTISKKYLVDPAEIYKLNKFATEGVKQGMVLQIPVPKREVIQQEDEAQTPENGQANSVSETIPDGQATNQPRAEVAVPPVDGSNTSYPSEHVVSSGETLYSLSRQYNVAVNDIKAANEGRLEKGLKVGQVVKIPASGKVIKSEPFKEVVREPAPQSNQSAQPMVITHKVEPKETLYSLSKKYGVTVDEIKAQNPDVQIHGLQIGQVLSITKN